MREASRLSGRNVEVVHIVGGGSRNELLWQLTADEGRVALRLLIRVTHPVRTYRPRTHRPGGRR